jgi:hypothetical protein
MKRLTTITLAGLALALGFCPGASAAVSLGFTEAAHKGMANRGDESIAYSVKLKNTGSTATTETTTVALLLPAGAKLGSGSGSGWSCHPNAGTCTNATAIAGGSEFPPLELRVWLLPEAPDVIAARFFAYGGGAGSEASAEDSFAFGPAVPFGVTGLFAGACGPASSPATLEALYCPEAEAHGASPFVAAGGHPYAASSGFSFATHVSPSGGSAAVESLRDLFIDLPPGLLGNPRAVGSICTFRAVDETGSTEVCPASAAVGGITIETSVIVGGQTPIYRIVPEEGYVAAFAFHAVRIGGPTIAIRVKVRSNGDYGVSVSAPLSPQKPELLRTKFATLCGYGAKVHVGAGGTTTGFEGCKLPGQPGSNPIPFLTNPTRCAGGEPLTKVTIDSYQHPGASNAEGFPDLSDPDWKVDEAKSPAITGCEALTEAWVGEGPEPEEEVPSFGFQPDTTQAAAPVAYSADLQIPQKGLVEREGRATADLKSTTIKLPKGVVLNPAAASGLGACTEAQVGYLGNDFPAPNPIHFDTTSEGCPQNSKLGTVEVTTPLLDKVLHGTIYLAAQRANPFGSDFAVYLVVEDPETGIVAKLAGLVQPSESEAGQITATFDDNPQVPLEDVNVDFFSGPRASLINPDVCGHYSTETKLTPWSAQDPDQPLLSETTVSDSPVEIAGAPEGRASCPASKPARPFGLGFSAGVSDATAGARTPFSLRITRPQGDQELDKITAATPPGFTARLKGVAICPQSAIDQAAARKNSGEGALELNHPSCPAASQVGTTTIGAGTGRTDGISPSVFYVKTGKVYLTGPYKGAPLSFTFIVPAVAGPFDLGVQVVRTALRVDSKTAQVTAESDPIPQMLDGIPLDIRDVRVDLDPGFSVNPTNCEPMAISGKVTGANGAVANISNPFQVGDCASLKFKPNLKIQLHGGTKRADYQRLTATVTYPEGPGYANISRAAVTLPHSEFLAQEHIRTVCTRVQFAAHACPAGSIYGHATAMTPLLDQPLTGPVYLRSSDNKLPDLVAALRGPDAQPIEVELDGRTDSIHGGIRNTFDLVPDAPVSKFTLQLQGGKKSLIVNSRNLCAGPKQRATVRLNAQNGMQRNFRQVVENDCQKRGGKGKKRSGRHGKQQRLNLESLSAHW